MEENIEVQKPEEMTPGGQEITKQDEAYISGLMNMLHAPETSPHIVEILKSVPPEQSIAEAAMTVNTKFEKTATAGGKKPELKTTLLALVYLTIDLIEIGNAAGVFQIAPEEIQVYLTAVLQKYVEAGLKNGTIDPVELQAAVEPLMGENQTKLGNAMGVSAGIPPEANQRTAMESYASERERKVMDEMARKVAAEKGPVQPGMLQGGQ